MLKAIDSGGRGSVYVMQVEDGADIAGMGGLMGTAMFARGFAGAVIDDGVRDLPQLRPGLRYWPCAIHLGWTLSLRRHERANRL